MERNQIHLLQASGPPAVLGNVAHPENPQWSLLTGQGQGDADMFWEGVVWDGSGLNVDMA